MTHTPQMQNRRSGCTRGSLQSSSLAQISPASENGQKQGAEQIAAF
jgi:hypothetical protein